MKKPGAISSVTKARIINAATKEFENKPYEKASLRTICNDADVTTGALYFFFKSKEDLFKNVISVCTRPLYNFLKDHYDYARKNVGKNYDFSQSFDTTIGDFLLRSYYDYTVQWKIVLKNLDHNIIKKMITNFIEGSTEHYYELLNEYFTNNRQEYRIEKYTIEQFVYMEIYAFVNLFRYDCTKEIMYKKARTTVSMLKGAFYALLEN